MLVSLLRPTTVSSKIVSGAGEWSVRKPRYADPAFCLMLEGTCLLHLDGLEATELRHGDFLLLPDTPGFVLSSGHGIEPTALPLEPNARETRHGSKEETATMSMLGGYFRFEPTNAPLLTPLLPRVVLVARNDPKATRLHRIVELIAEETDSKAPNGLILERLVEVLLVEAMRLQTAPIPGAQRGLIAGLSDPWLAPALRAMHADLAYGWTVERLAREASVSRAVFAEKFSRAVEMPPMQYLIHWRMAAAMEMLRAETLSMSEVARRVGYQSATAFTNAFTRHTGKSPRKFVQSW
jgi:AraC-like DNA-binding protein